MEAETRRGPAAHGARLSRVTRVRTLSKLLTRVLPVLAALLSGACATAAKAPVRVDLEPARKAVGEARASGGSPDAREALARAELHLQQAEALAGQQSAAVVPNAQREADLAVAEALCALGAARVATTYEAAAARTAAVVPAPDTDRSAIQARIRRAEEEQHRLGDKLTVLQRDLELTETELIRSKARLKGNETKAEASAAIAEARILAQRLGQDRARSSSYARVQASLGRAEEQLVSGNFGAAIFFAMKAQDTATKAADAPAASVDKPAPRKTYVAKREVNLRKGPATTEEVLAKIATGTSLQASVVRGDWVKVTHEGTAGWVHRSLLE
jgi:hypothetical protein